PAPAPDTAPTVATPPVPQGHPALTGCSPGGGAPSAHPPATSRLRSSREDPHRPSGTTARRYVDTPPASPTSGARGSARPAPTGPQMKTMAQPPRKGRGELHDRHSPAGR